MCSFLNENFVTFGWDLTFSSNKTRAVNMITKHFGSVAASTLKNLDIERLPVLVLVYKLRGSMEIFQVRISILSITVWPKVHIMTSTFHSCLIKCNFWIQVNPNLSLNKIFLKKNYNHILVVLVKWKLLNIYWMFWKMPTFTFVIIS